MKAPMMTTMMMMVFQDGHDMAVVTNKIIMIADIAF